MDTDRFDSSVPGAVPPWIPVPSGSPSASTAERGTTFAEPEPSSPLGPTPPAVRTTRRRAVAGMAALAIVAAALASGGTTLAFIASGALDRPVTPVVRTDTPATVANFVPSGDAPAGDAPAGDAPAGDAPAGGAGGSSTTAAAPANGSVVSAAARVSPAVVTIITSSSAGSVGSGGGALPFGQGNGGVTPGGSSGQSVYGLPAGQTPVSVGSGFIFNANGWILTNHHVVADPGTLTVQLADGRSFPATVYGMDTLTDLAIVKIAATGLPTATLGDSSTLQVGQTAIAVGDPLGQYPGTVTTGVVSGIDRSISDTTSRLDDLIQTDAAINPGNSGGPLVDVNGAVIGIDTAIAGSAQGIGFAIPINVARPLTQQALAGQKLVRSWVGIQYQTLNAGLASRNHLSVDAGAWITSGGTGSAVQSGSPAAAAGLRENDIITAVDGTKLDTNHPLVELLSSRAPGSTVTMAVRRGTSDLSIQVTLATRPATLN